MLYNSMERSSCCGQQVAYAIDLSNRVAITHKEKPIEMLLPSSFANNAIILISSKRKNELNVARRLADDLATFRVAIVDFHFEHHEVKTRQELFELLMRIARQAKKGGLRPIIHFDMHGDAIRGLEISASNEFASWSELNDWLRKINIRTGNNLCVVAASCHGLQMIRPISIHHPVPYFCLIAPEREVTLGFIDEKLSAFYQTLFQNSDLDSALAHLKEHFKQFHCEKMLAVAFAKYIKYQCKGVGWAKRKEELITGALARGIPNTAENLKSLRKQAINSIRPTDELIASYAKKFLIGKPFPATLKDILQLVNESYAPN